MMEPPLPGKENSPVQELQERLLRKFEKSTPNGLRRRHPRFLCALRRLPRLSGQAPQMLRGDWSSLLNHRGQGGVRRVRTVSTSGGVMPTGAGSGSAPSRSLQEEVRVACFHYAPVRENHHLWQGDGQCI